MVNILPEMTAYKLASFISDIQYCCSPRDRHAVTNNLRVILGKDGKDIHRLAREVFRNFGKYLVEFFRMERMLTKEFIMDRIRIRGIENLKKVLSEGKGGIIVTAHLGNWELGGVVLSSLGYPSVAIALPHKERPVNDLFNHQRESRGIKVIPASFATRHCMQALKENKLIALVGDRDFGGHGEEMDFLGRKAFIPKGAALFSIKTGAPIIPIFFVRDENDHFDLNICEPIYSSFVQDGVIENERVISLIKQYIVIIEDKIREFPSQWLMFREFWGKSEKITAT